MQVSVPTEPIGLRILYYLKKEGVQSHSPALEGLIVRIKRGLDSAATQIETGKFSLLDYKVLLWDPKIEKYLTFMEGGRDLTVRPEGTKPSMKHFRKEYGEKLEKARQYHPDKCINAYVQIIATLDHISTTVEAFDPSTRSKEKR